MKKFRYWYHPESDCLWFTGPDADEKAQPGSELVEELSREEYEQILARKIEDEA